ncbi:MAG: hypothetical protein AAFN10_09725 [Bacteroidota bacterium]
MKKYLILSPLLLACFLANGQTLEATSNQLSLDFGYPELRFKNDAIRFIDENDNGIIDPGEGTIIRLVIENLGKYPANDVRLRPQELNQINGLELPEEIEVGDIAAGEQKVVQVGVAAADELDTGTANFIFYAKESAEKGRVSVVYAVATVVDPNE